MRRWDCLVLLVAAALGDMRPLAAQQSKRLPTVSIIYSVGSVSDYIGTNPLGVNMRAFERALRDRGWIDRRTVIIERQSSEGDPGRASLLLAEIVGRKPDVILLGGARWLHEAALKETRNNPIPIVAPFGEDPVAAGLACMP